MQRFSSISIRYCFSEFRFVKNALKWSLYHSWKRIDRGAFFQDHTGFNRRFRKNARRIEFLPRFLHFFISVALANSMLWPNCWKFQIYRDARGVAINVKKMFTSSKGYSRWFINIKKTAAAYLFCKRPVRGERYLAPFLSSVLFYVVRWIRAFVYRL